MLSTANQQVPSEEVLHTLFVQIEGIVNGRLLVNPSSDRLDERPLSPNDLLLVKGDSLDTTDCISTYYRKIWRQFIHLVSVFWRRWLREYLPTLQIRRKWTREVEPPRIGEIVLLNSPSTNRNRWPLAIVERLERSADGLIRTVVLRTSQGVLREDLRSVYRLEGVDSKIDSRHPEKSLSLRGSDTN